MLRQDVLDAVAAGQFHVYSAANIDEALEILTGFSATSIDNCVLARVDELHKLAREFNTKEGGKDDQ